MSIVKTQDSPRWQEVTFQIFDIPSEGSQPFEHRLQNLHDIIDEIQAKGPADHLVIVEQSKYDRRLNTCSTNTSMNCLDARAHSRSIQNWPACMPLAARG